MGDNRSLPQMKGESSDYFDNIVMPLVRDRHSEILQDASVMILGSVGLGNDDELSDVEAVFYLPSEIWKEKGAWLQLTLDQCLRETNPWKQENGSILCVHPLSWLLDTRGEGILADDGTVPWEELSFESLFTLQANPIYHDPQNRLGRLREMTAPSQMPENRWKKTLYTRLNDFVECGVCDIRRSVDRELYSEAHIQFGRAVQNLFEMGFLACHQYYPYLKHLRWAFGRLPPPISNSAAEFDLLSVATDWQEKTDILEAIYDAFRDYIVSNSVLPEIDFDRIDLHNNGFIDELIFSGRFGAWDNPDWRSNITKYKEQAVKNGFETDQWGIFQLWGTDWICTKS
jgi:hypothetical protein